MGEREYIGFTEDKGNIKISEDVVAAIVATACTDTDGVAAMANASQSADFAEFFSKKSAARGVRVDFNDDNSCNVNVFLMVKFGAAVTEVAKNTQEAVKSAVEAMAGIKVNQVDVFISGIVFPK